MASTLAHPVIEAPLSKIRQLQEVRARVAEVKAKVAALRPPAPRPWHDIARSDQRPPATGTWLIYLALAGRGWGKTQSGSQWLAEQAVLHPGTEWAVIAPVWRDCRKVCIEGKSGLLNAFLPGELLPGAQGYNASDLVIRLANGSRIYGYSADRPDRIRGANLAGGWVDELAAMHRAEELWDEALMPALRIGEYPRLFVTTTPKPTPLLKRLLGRDDDTVLTVRGKTWDNAANLSRAALAELKLRYDGTRLGRQELEGELLDDVDGALWSRQLIEDLRVIEAPQLARIVIGVDPAVTSGEKSDSTGIVVVGLGMDGDLYVLEDLTRKGTPAEVMSHVVKAYYRWKADRVVGEVNNGGDYIGAVLRQVDPNVPYKSVTATRGKRLRAEPTAAIWEQRRGHIVGAKVGPDAGGRDFTALEDQMCTWVPDDKTSPDNLDAMVWASTELTTGASAMAFLTAISRQCSVCSLPNPAAATRCRSCGTPLESPEPEA